MKKSLMSVLETEDYKLLLHDVKSNSYDIFKKSKENKEPQKICELHVIFKYVTTNDGEKTGCETYDIELEVSETTKIIPINDFKKMIWVTIS